jgi:hypothetical protein
LELLVTLEMYIHLFFDAAAGKNNNTGPVWEPAFEMGQWLPNW